MAEIVYILCTVTSVLCAVLLFRAYRKHPVNLIFWCCLCFVGFTLNNMVVFADTYLVPNVDLSIWRLVPALLGLSALLFGLVKNNA